MAPTLTKKMIELTQLSKCYAMPGSEITVLKELNLMVEPKERVAIVGPSGSGKSTLLLILTGLETPSSGSISVAEQPLDTMNNDQRADLRRKHIGIVFQSFHLIPSLTALENVALPADRADHYPSQLSGGEQQRVAMARALVHEPELIVADEPTGNLDEKTGELVMKLLFDLNRDSGTTLLLVTHDIYLAEQCDRTLRLQDGQLHAVEHKSMSGSAS